MANALAYNIVELIAAVNSFILHALVTIYHIEPGPLLYNFCSHNLKIFVIS